MNLWQAVGVFFAAILTDVTWAGYTLSVSHHKPVVSAIWSVGIVVVGAISIAAIAESLWCVFPAAAGAFIGTFATVWWHKRRM